MEKDLKQECVERLLSIGILERLTSPWAAENLFVPKRDHGVRVTTNLRALNNVTITGAQSVEDVHNALGWLSSKKMFSSSGLEDEFYQVKLDEESRLLTAVRTVLGLLQYRRLP